MDHNNLQNLIYITIIMLLALLFEVHIFYLRQDIENVIFKIQFVIQNMIYGNKTSVNPLT